MISVNQKPTGSNFGAKSEPSEVLAGIELHGKNVIVTGGYSGIGLETTRALKDCGARVIVPARRKDVAKTALNGIIPSDDIVEMDLADINSVQSFVDNFIDEGVSLDLLINNAGVMACPEGRIGNEWERQFGVNQIGHFVLTRGLMGVMEKNEGSRFVSLSSSAHSLTSILWDDIHFNETQYDKWVAYGQSKTASSLIAIEFDRLMKDKGVRGYSVHPGGIMTPLQRHLDNEEMVALGWVKEDGSPSDMAASFFKSTTQGATTSLWCATNDALDDIGGVFCENCDVAVLKKEVDDSMKRFVGVADWAIDSEEATKLWETTEHMLNS
jgi:NAD(P)-dependent dehydrogenase (short-subunit alcohol dehydrogenase family)|tara:strand:- start:862 stop:1839 length:978 start_codon:yes stop_codon:yes gene_type:complete